ncbi:MAG: lysylphosphatidylglycerol synthase transmembrane domain-containing protein [Bacteroidota bacterium]
MNKQLVNILKYFVFLAIAFGLLYLAFKDVDLNKVSAAIKRANFTWIVLGMVCGYLAFVFRGLRWKLLIEPMGYESRPWSSIHSVAVGYLANLAVPRLGEVTRCTVMNQADKVPVDKLFGTVLAERVIDLLMLAVCFLLVFILKLDDLQTLISQAQSGKASDPATPWKMYFLIAALFMVAIAGLIYRFRKQILNFPFVPRIVNFLKGVLSGFNTVLKIRQRGLFALYTLLIWIMYFLMSYLYFFCLPETSGLTASDGLFMMISGSLGIIAPAPGGIGAFHAAVIAALVALGVNRDLAGSMAIIVHTSQTLMTLVAGLLALFLLSLGRKKKQDGVLQQET